MIIQTDPKLKMCSLDFNRNLFQVLNLFLGENGIILGTRYPRLAGPLEKQGTSGGREKTLDGKNLD